MWAHPQNGGGECVLFLLCCGVLDKSLLSGPQFPHQSIGLDGRYSRSRFRVCEGTESGGLERLEGL